MRKLVKFEETRENFASIFPPHTTDTLRSESSKKLLQSKQYCVGFRRCPSKGSSHLFLQVLIFPLFTRANKIKSPCTPWIHRAEIEIGFRGVNYATKRSWTWAPSKSPAKPNQWERIEDSWMNGRWWMMRCQMFVICEWKISIFSRFPISLLLHLVSISRMENFHRYMKKVL